MFIIFFSLIGESIEIAYKLLEYDGWDDLSTCLMNPLISYDGT